MTSLLPSSSLCFSRWIFASAVALSFAFTAGCGSPSSPPTPTLTGNTAVTLLATSTANDQLQLLDIQFNSVTLTSQSGKTVTLLSNSIYPELMHLNGSAEPLASATIPQDIYSSAAVNIGSAQFTCVGLDSSGGLQTSTYAYGQTPAANVTVNMPSPITVTGTSMAISLNLLVSQSVTFGGCENGVNNPYSITPTFAVTPVTIAAQPSNATNGLSTGLQGLIASVDSGGATITVSGADGPNLTGASWQVATNSTTSFYGVTGAAQLAAGMPVDMDAAIQADGSLLATRVAVYDSDPTTLTAASGPLVQIASSQPTFFATGVQGQGYLVGAGIGTTPYNYGKALFQISNRPGNLTSLPFNAAFSDANMVPGQRVLITTHATAESSGPTYVPAATMTLMPQTIDATVSASASSGSFTTYTVQLAPYDLFPDLAVQAGQTSLLTNPGTMAVYVGSNTQQLNSDPITVGSTLRFHGLVFNDSGTLRMDCDQVNDGVAE